MQISSIKQQVKRQDRYSVYVDGKYLFSFSQSELLQSGIRVGQELTEQELGELKSSAMLDKAYDRALNLISHRPRSEGELRDYLRRKDLPSSDIDRVIAKLANGGYVDDLDFAMRWVSNRRLLKSTSKRRLTQELRQKRIADEIISEVLVADSTDERQVLAELIQRKRKQTKYQEPTKLMQYLSRQGFSYDDIKTAMSRLVEDED
ncbi:RecX family transcriptional regulator [Candidatus Saccharibacteria bacterium]|nr:RecX family transcriptional regulator [Candidatus Saccharibacteria bacterium]